MKIEDQLVDILTIAMGTVKFLELCSQIGVNKAWDEEKIEENVASDFLSRNLAGALHSRSTQIRAPNVHIWCTLSRYCSTCQDGTS